MRKTSLIILVSLLAILILAGWIGSPLSHLLIPAAEAEDISEVCDISDAENIFAELLYSDGLIYGSYYPGLYEFRVTAPGAEAVRIYLDDSNEPVSEEQNRMMDTFVVLEEIGEHTIYADAKYNGQWSEKKEIWKETLQTNGPLNITFSIPDIIEPGEGLDLTFDWNGAEVDWAYLYLQYIGDGGVTHIKTYGEYMEDQLPGRETYHIPGEDLNVPGEYQVALEYYKMTYDRQTFSQSFTVSGTDPGIVSYIVNSNEELAFYSPDDQYHIYSFPIQLICANATQFEWYDYYSGSVLIDSENGTAYREYSFEADPRQFSGQIQARALVNGSWTNWSECDFFGYIYNTSSSGSVPDAPPVTVRATDAGEIIINAGNSEEWDITVLKPDGLSCHFSSDENWAAVLSDYDLGMNGTYYIHARIYVNEVPSEYTIRKFTISKDRVPGPLVRIVPESDVYYANMSYEYELYKEGASRFEYFWRGNDEIISEDSYNGYAYVAKESSSNKAVLMCRAWMDDGYWSAWTEQEFRFIFRGQLPAPELSLDPEAGAQPMAGKDLTVLVTACDTDPLNINRYRIFLMNAAYETLLSGFISPDDFSGTGYEWTVSGSVLKQGDYRIGLYAIGLNGYDPSNTVYITFPVVGVQAESPSLTTDPEGDPYYAGSITLTAFAEGAVRYNFRIKDVYAGVVRNEIVWADENNYGEYVLDAEAYQYYLIGVSYQTEEGGLWSEEATLSFEVEPLIAPVPELSGLPESHTQSSDLTFNVDFVPDGGYLSLWLEWYDEDNDEWEPTYIHQVYSAGPVTIPGWDLNRTGEYNLYATIYMPGYYSSGSHYVFDVKGVTTPLPSQDLRIDESLFDLNAIPVGADLVFTITPVRDTEDYTYTDYLDGYYFYVIRDKEDGAHEEVVWTYYAPQDEHFTELEDGSMQFPCPAYPLIIPGHYHAFIYAEGTGSFSNSEFSYVYFTITDEGLADGPAITVSPGEHYIHQEIGITLSMNPETDVFYYYLQYDYGTSTYGSVISDSTETMFSFYPAGTHNIYASARLSDGSWTKTSILPLEIGSLGPAETVELSNPPMSHETWKDFTVVVDSLPENGWLDIRLEVDEGEWGWGEIDCRIARSTGPILFPGDDFYLIGQYRLRLIACVPGYEDNDSIQYVFDVTDEGNPVQQLDFCSWNGRDSAVYYLGVDDDLENLETDTLQIDPFVTQYWLNHYDVTRAELTGDPEFIYSAEGTAVFRIEPHPDWDQPCIDVYLEEMPDEPETDTIHLSCIWEGYSWEQDYEVTFMSSPTGGLPAGMVYSFDEPLEFVAGTEFWPDNMIAFNGGWTNQDDPFYKIDLTCYSELFGCEMEWNFSRYDEDTGHNLYTQYWYGNYTGFIKLTSGKLVWKHQFSFRVTDENGDIPAPDLDFCSWNGMDNAVYYLGVDDNLESLETNTLQIDPYVTQYWLNNTDEARAVLTGDPEFSYSVEGTATFRIEPHPGWDQPAINIYLEEMPDAPEVDTIHLSCVWEGSVWEQDYEVVFMASPTGGLPAGVVCSFDEPLEFVAGTEFCPKSMIAFSGGWTNQDDSFYKIDLTWYSEYYGYEQEWNYSRYDYNISAGLYTLSQYGEYTGFIQITSGKLIWKHQFTIRVTDENGDIPAPDLDFYSGMDSAMYYLGVDDDLETFEMDTLQIEPYVTQYWLQNADEVRVALRGDPEFAYSVEGTAVFRIELHPDWDYPCIDIYLEKMPNEPETDTIHLSCVWEDSVWEQVFEAVFMAYPAGGLPAGIVCSFDEPLEFVAGTEFCPKSMISFSNGWTNQDDIFYLTWYSDLYGCEDEWFYVRYDEDIDAAWYTMNEYGEYTGFINFVSGNMFWKHQFTFRVTDENGDVPLPDLVLKGSDESTYYLTSLSNTPDAKGRYSRDSNIAHFFISYQDYLTLRSQIPGSPVWSIEDLSADIDLSLQVSEEYYCALGINTRPSEPCTITLTIVCTWGDYSCRKPFTLHVEVPESLPEGMIFEPGETWTFTVGKAPAHPADLLRMIDGWELPGVSPESTWEINADCEWVGDGFYFYGPVISASAIELDFANIVCRKEFTLIVLNEDGTLPASADRLNDQSMIRLPDAITQIGSEAFADTALLRVDIPQGVTDIADDAFNGCGLVLVYSHSDYVTDYALRNGLIPVVED